MSIVFMDSFDHYVEDDIAKKWDYYSMPDVFANITLSGRRGTYAFRFNSGTLGSAGWLGYIHPGWKTEWIIGFACYFDTSIYDGDTSWGRNGILFNGGAWANVNTRTCLTITSDGGIQIRPRTTSSTIYAQSAGGVLVPDQWQYLEWRNKPHDTLGESEVRINGETVIDHTGDTSQYGNTSGDRLAIHFRGHTTIQDIWRVEDLYIMSTDEGEQRDFLGDIQVDAHYPDGVGAYSEWTPSSGSNFENVDEAQHDGDTSYNGVDLPDIVGKQDLYELEDTDGEGYVKAIQLMTMTKKIGSGTRLLRPQIKSGGSEYLGSEIGLGESYGMSRDIWENNPTSGSPWETSEVDSLQAGVEVSG